MAMNFYVKDLKHLEIGIANRKTDSSILFTRTEQIVPRRGAQTDEISENIYCRDVARCFAENSKEREIKNHHPLIERKEF